MISKLKIRNFKSLESLDLKLGHFNLLVGANASGKSNFLDALRFLKGLGNDLDLNEILNGKPSSTLNARWEGIRGGARYFAFLDRNGKRQEPVSFDIETSLPLSQEPSAFDYHLAVSIKDDHAIVSEESASDIPGSHLLNVIRENLLTNDTEGNFKSYYVSRPTAGICVRTFSEDIEKVTEHTEEANALSNTYGPFQDFYRSLRDLFHEIANMQFLDPDPVILRGYADHGRIAQMGEHGEGFAGIIKQICGSPSSYDALLEWLKNLRPDEITSLTTVEAPAGELMLAVNEYSRQFLAPTLSEGTLRFIALAAAFFQPVMPKVIVLEEIEKGLHPSRLRLLLELMRTQSKRTNTQVIATTHSPTLLSWLTSEDRKTTFVCSRDAESGATQMHSLAELPDLESILSKGSALSELFEQGWMESVL